MKKSIAIGSDHAGYELKEVVKNWLERYHYGVKDYGTTSQEPADYPDFAHLVANAVEMNEVDLGILICGSGNGVCMTANKHRGIRAALCWNEELASLARLHNNANVLCLPARYIQQGLALVMVEKFISTSFEGGRHERRVGKINTGSAG